MSKIYLSPSNQNANLYAWGNTTEMEQCNRIAEAAEAALIRNGFDVKRAAKGQGLEKSIAESNAWGADLHVPIHTNAANGSITGGTLVMVYSVVGEREKVGRAVLNAVAPLTPGGDYALRAKPGFYEIKNANAITVYLECEFHDTAEGAKFIVENTDKLGEALAKGICDYYGEAFETASVKQDVTASASKANEEVRAWQVAAAYDGFSFPKFGFDGMWGSECEGVAKKALVKKTIPYKNKNLTRFVQERIGVAADGLCGNQTTAAIKSWQKINGLTADGVIGLNSWKKLLNI